MCWNSSLVRSFVYFQSLLYSKIIEYTLLRRWRIVRLPCVRYQYLTCRRRRVRYDAVVVVVPTQANLMTVTGSSNQKYTDTKEAPPTPPKTRAIRQSSHQMALWNTRTNTSTGWPDESGRVRWVEYSQVWCLSDYLECISYWTYTAGVRTQWRNTLSASPK